MAVLGAGNGGQAMAAHLALKGFRVNLFNRTEERLQAIRKRGGIETTGAVSGFGPLSVASSDMGEALENAQLIMVVVPATGHADLAVAAAPHLQDGQVIVLHPGRTGGALEFHNVLAQAGCTADVIIAEAQTFIYAARLENPAQVKVFRVKNTIPVAAFPAYRTTEVLRLLSLAYDQFVPGDNVLKTSLDNIGAIFHPAITALNAARIESTRGDFEYYLEGITPSVANVLEAMDRERVAVAAALGIRATSAREWLYLAYDAAGRTLYEAIQNNPGYRGIKAPATVCHRYITEDVPASLVPIASFGDHLGVPTTVTKAIVDLCSLILGRDFLSEGRTMEKLGLSGLSLREIRRYVLEGSVVPCVS